MGDFPRNETHMANVDKELPELEEIQLPAVQESITEETMMLERTRRIFSDEELRNVTARRYGKTAYLAAVMRKIEEWKKSGEWPLGEVDVD
jgi:hypothetical protein